ncbi:MAG: CRISPR system precrRNA processing endoribonuclease RAMP protein Cas6 [Magnetococcales bacterium]|nr:CRISPR system precrRNA processing endoribonuclease RAMP protein Cas6 [Magnetococcales bacterium]
MNTPSHPFSIARYLFDWEVETPMRLPEYAGSALRGVFGAALRRITCLTDAATCAGCGITNTCPWSMIFEAPPPAERHAVQHFARIPNPYIIEPPAWGKHHFHPGERLTFGMVLVGRALAQLPLIILAWQRALGRGVGHENGTARLLGVRHVLPDGSEQVVYDPTVGVVIDHAREISPASMLPSATERITLNLLTPLRIQREGKPLGPGRLTPRDFLLTLARRISLLAEFHAGVRLGLDFSDLTHRAEALTAHGSLGWRDWTRWSGRQQQEMTLGGVTGRWTLRGDLTPFWSLLYLGQWLHVGKNATFGLGRYWMMDDAAQEKGGILV